jgi:hypothetical protein
VERAKNNNDNSKQTRAKNIFVSQSLAAFAVATNEMQNWKISLSSATVLTLNNFFSICCAAVSVL